MSKLFKNRVYGIVGIGVQNANLNADMEGNPRQTSLGDYFATHQSLKYACRRYWVENNEKVLVMKSFKEKEGKGGVVTIEPKNLEERYIDLFGEISKDQTEVMKNLFTSLDVMNFGVVFPVAKCNFGITGVVQFDNGKNLMEETSDIMVNVLSPYQNSNSSDAQQSTMGIHTIIDEGHYFYNVSVQPANLDVYNGLMEYTEEAYLKLKESLMYGVTNLNSAAKKGCENEFGLFVKVKEGSKLRLNNLTKYISFTYDREGKNVLDLTNLATKLERYMDQIEEIEIIYDDFVLELEGVPEGAILNVI